MECIFCKIINNQIPSKIIYEDNIVKVFLDINPSRPGECLIVTKKHIKDALDMDDDTFKHLNSSIKKVYEIINSKLKIDGFEIIQNNGICSEVKHYHIHFVPKYKKEQNLTIEEVYELLK